MDEPCLQTCPMALAPFLVSINTVSSIFIRLFLTNIQPTPQNLASPATGPAATQMPPALAHHRNFDSNLSQAPLATAPRLVLLAARAPVRLTSLANSQPSRKSRLRSQKMVLPSLIWSGCSRSALPAETPPTPRRRLLLSSASSARQAGRTRPRRRFYPSGIRSPE